MLQVKLPENDKIIAIDPGETTGICAFDSGELISATQLDTASLSDAYYSIRQYCVTIFSSDQLSPPTKIVCEDYEIYAHKLKQHTWAKLHTPKVIGICAAIAYDLNSIFITRLASNPKSFVTDVYLRQNNLYIKGKRHARDAVRHAIYEVIYSNGKTKAKMVSG